MDNLCSNWKHKLNTSLAESEAESGAESRAEAHSDKHFNGTCKTFVLHLHRRRRVTIQQQIWGGPEPHPPKCQCPGNLDWGDQEPYPPS